MEKVYVENAYYDGPRSGVADYAGSPHRFISNFDDTDGYLDTFNLFPITSDELKLEIEQWNIFVEWNRFYERDEVTTDSHPGHGDINERWDELEIILKPMREAIPDDALLARARFESIEQESCYEASGPSYGVTWEIIKET